jgi:hypothetical protein
VLPQKPALERRTTNLIRGSEELAAELRVEALVYFQKPIQERVRSEMLPFIEMVSVVPFFCKQFEGLANLAEDEGAPAPDADEFYLDCLEGLEIERFLPGECLFHHGSWGDRLYYILEGDV